MNHSQQHQMDYLISKGFTQEIALERLGINEAVSPLHPVYGNRTADEYFQHFYGMTPDQVRAFVKDQKELKAHIARRDDRQRGRNRNLTKDQLDEAKSMRDSGISWKIIGKVYRLSEDAIRKAVTRHENS